MAPLRINKTRIQSLGFYFSCALASLCLWGGGVLGIKTSTLTISIYLIALLGAFILSLLIFKDFYLSPGRRNTFLFILIFWLIYSVLQLPFCSSLFQGVRYILIIGSSLFPLMFCSYFVTSKKQFVIFLGCMLFSMSISHAFNLVEIFSGHYFWVDKESDPLKYQYLITKRDSNIFSLYVPIGQFNNQNNLAMFCVCCLVPLSFFYLLVKGAFFKTLTVISGLVDIFVLVCTDSRSGILGLVAFAMFFIMFNIFKTPKKSLYFMGFVFLLASFFIIFYLKKSFSQPTIGDYESNVTRVYMILDGLYILFTESFGFGVGLGQVEIHMAQYANTGGIPNLHNFFVEILTSSGCIVFLLLIFVYFYALRFFFAASFREGSQTKQSLSRVCFGYLMAFFVISIGPSSSVLFTWVWMMFVLISMMHSFIESSFPKIKTDYVRI